MAAFSDRQASILSYCRIDDPTPEDLSLLEGFHADAVSYMRSAGVAEPEAGSARLPQYNTCILALVLDADPWFVSLAIQAESFIKCPICLWRVRSKKWIHDVTLPEGAR